MVRSSVIVRRRPSDPTTCRWQSLKMKSVSSLTEFGNKMPFLEKLTNSVKLSMEGTQTTEKILHLTMEIIYLLTGEDYIIVKNTGEGLAHDIHPHKSDKCCRTRRLCTDPSTHSAEDEKHNETKDVELPNKIIQLKPGEVAVRCEDVAVYLSVEEWEYVEGHQELYKDVILATHQPVCPPVGAPRQNAPNSSSEDYRSGERRKRGISCKKRKSKKRSMRCVREKMAPCEKSDQNGRPPPGERGPAEKEESASCQERNLTNADVSLPTTEHALAEESPTPTKEDSASGVVGDHSDPDAFPSTEHTQTEQPSPHIKDELTSCVGGEHSDGDMYLPTDDARPEYPSACTVEEPTSHEKGDPAVVDINTPTDRGGMLCMTNIKEETALWDEVNLTGGHLYTQHTAIHYPSTHVSASWNGGNLRDTGPYTPNKHKDYVYTHMEGRPASYEQGNLTGTDIYFPSGHAQTGYPSTSISAGSDPFEDGSLQGATFDIPSEHALVDDLFYYDKAYGEEPTDGFGMKCGECGKIFNNKMALVCHQRTHGVGGMYNCSQCQKCFSSIADLLRHQALYSGKNLTCTECSRHFISKSNLVRHYRVHTGKRPFACLECGKSFRSMWNLAQHRVTHTGEKPFTCFVCGKSFSRSSHLVTHQRSHTGEKPYACLACGKYFAQKSNLLTHQRTHTRDKPFQCSDTGESFTGRESLLSHQTIHGREKSPVFQ